MKLLQSMVMRLTCMSAMLVLFLFSGNLKAETPLDRLVKNGGEPAFSMEVETSRIASEKWKSYIKDYVLFDYNAQVTSRVKEERPEAMMLTIPTTRGDYELNLVRVDITTPDFRAVSASGKVMFDQPFGIHYRGTVNGKEGSLVAVSFFDEEFVALASTPADGNVTVARVEDGSGRYAAYFDQDMTDPPGLICHTQDPVELPAFLQEPRIGTGLFEKPGQDLCVTVHYLVDNQLYVNKGSVEASVAWVEAMHNQIAALYALEFINIITSYVEVWDVPDPFNIFGQEGSFDALIKLDNYFTAGANLNGNIGHLLTLDLGGNGGIANGIGTFIQCDQHVVCYSDVDPTYAIFPNYSWTTVTAAHEMGHLMGSPHTHGCYWNGNNTQIDDCANSVGLPEGQDCYDPGNPIIPPEGGTLMSYCDYNGTLPGINMSLALGPQPGDLVRLTLQTSIACLEPCPDPACHAPYQIEVDNITENAATVSWYHASAGEFEVTYGYPGNWTTETVNTTTMDLNGLMSGTKYRVFVKAVCGGVESLENNQDFKTICNTVYDLPYIELFEGNAWERESYELDACWDQTISSNGYGWVIASGMTQSGGTGPEGDHTTGFGKYIFTEASLGEVGEETVLFTPSIDLGSAEGPFVSFWHHMFGSSIDRLSVHVSNNNGATWSILKVLLGEQLSAETDPWVQEVVSLSNYEGDVVQLRFTARLGENNDEVSFQGDIAIDDIIVTDSSLVDLSLSSINSPVSGCGVGAAENVVVTLENSGYETLTTGTQIDLDLRLDGSLEASEVLILDNNLAPGASIIYTFAKSLDLSDPGDYQVSVSSNLATDQVAGNNDRGKRVINKPIIASYPYQQSFESGSDWTTGGVESSWALGTPAKRQIVGAADGQNAWVTGGLGLNTYNAYEESYLEGPCFDFSLLADPYIEFDVWWEIETIWEGATFQYSTNAVDWFPLGVKGEDWFNSDTITTMPNIDGWTGTDDGDNSFDGSEGWVRVNHDLTGLGEEPSVFLRMLLKTDPYVEFDGIAMDNIFIYGTPLVPPCHEVTLNLTTCDPQQSGTNIQVLQDKDGCDSVVTTQTVLLESPRDTVYETTCNPAEAGVFTDVIAGGAANGCDSTVVTITTDVPSYDDTIYATTCDPGEVGTVVQNLKTVNDCDSIITVITELFAYDILVQQTTCDPAMAGQTVDTLTASDGCDSVVTVNTVLVPVEAGFTYTNNNGDVSFTNTSSNATDYQWDFGDGGTSTNADPDHSYAEEGVYVVMLIASDGDCPPDTATMNVNVVISGIELISFLESVTVFPNPSDGNFAVEVVGDARQHDLSFILLNVAGAALNERVVPYNGNTRVIYNMDDLPNGIYMLQIRAGEEQTAVKVNVLR